MVAFEFAKLYALEQYGPDGYGFAAYEPSNDIDVGYTEGAVEVLAKLNGPAVDCCENILVAG